MLPAQVSFSAGEVSPRFISRSDSKGYKEGALALENILPLAQGPAFRRGGTRFTYMLPAGIDKARILPFQVSFDDYFLAVFYDLNMQILNKFGEVVQPELVLNGTFIGASNWTPVTSSGSTVTFGATSCSLAASGSGSAAIRQLVTNLVVGVQYRFSIIQLAPLDEARLRVGTTPGGNEVAELLSTLATPQLDFVATATSHWIEVASIPPPATVVISLVSVTAVATGIPLSSPFTEDLLSVLQAEMTPEGTKMVIVSGSVAPQELIFTPPSTFSLLPIAFTAPPASWVAGSYPRTVTFHQGRLWMGGTLDRPASFWASKSNDYYNFTAGSLADDALAFTIAKKGAIRWMLGLKQMLIGTDFREHVITGGDNTEVITPSSISIQPQSAYGSAPTMPSQLGNLVLYASADGRRLYSMGYRFDESGWVSTDLAFAAQHITAGRVQQMAFAQSPENILWSIDFDGKLLSMSYDRDNKVVGWARHPNLNAQYVSIASAKLLGLDQVWLAARLQVDSQTRIQILSLPSPFELPYMDHQLVVVSGAPQLVFAGFDHLKGYVVDILADGAVHSPRLVTAGGTIQLDREATEVIAGLRAKARFVSMPIDVQDSSQTTASRMKRAVRSYVQLLSSGLPIINGKRPPDRSPPTPMDTPEPPGSQRIFSVGMGYGLIEQIVIEEDQPIPLNIAGIYYSLAAEGTAK